MQIQDIVMKWTDPIRVAEATAIAPGYGHENLGRVFALVLPEVLEHLRNVGAHPGISIAYYEAPSDDGSVMLHAGFDIGDQEVTESDRVRAVGLPVVEVASIVHRGTMDGIASAFEAMIRWSEDSGFTWAEPTRELSRVAQRGSDPARHGASAANRSMMSPLVDVRYAHRGVTADAASSHDRATRFQPGDLRARFLRRGRWPRRALAS